MRTPQVDAVGMSTRTAVLTASVAALAATGLGVLVPHGDASPDARRSLSTAALSERGSTTQVQPLVEGSRALQIARARELVRQGKRRKPGTTYRVNSRTVCHVYLLSRKCEHRLSPAAKARKAARITRHRRYLAAKYRRHQRYLAAKQMGFYAARVYAQMQKIDAASVPYLWGGGHARQIGWTEPVTPMDCSGSVSRALGIYPRVSGAFASWGKPGRGKITVYSNSIHVYMSIRVGGVERFWGTSRENPGGGPGWHSPRSGAGFVARHAG